MLVSDINLVITFVVRFGEEVVLEVDGREYFVRWSPVYSQPEVVKTGTTITGTTIIDSIYGIVQVVDWLKSLPKDTNFRIVTK